MLPPGTPARPDLLLYDRHLDDSRPWVTTTVVCGCGYQWVAVYRVDRTPTCPRCCITDRVTVLDVK